MTQVLRPELYDRLEELFDEVRVSNPGQPLVEEDETEWAVRGRRAVPRSKPRIASRGETYRVRCPFCGDERFRLYVNHAWGLKDPRTGADRLWLAKCFNEENCLADRGRRFELRRMVFGTGPLPCGPVVGTAGRAERARPANSGPALPEWLIPLNKLPAGDPVRVYLLRRGFDPDVLGRELGVGFCTWAPSPYVEARNRIVVPVELNGEIVGYQGRRVDGAGEGDLNAPKWWTAPGTPKAKTLYNLDTARTYSVAVVCEGVSAVWRVGPCAVGLFGLDMSPEQERLLAENWTGATVVMLLDNDGAANPVAQRRNRQYSRRLRRHFGDKVVEVTLPEGTDPGDLSRAAVWSLIRSAAGRQGVALPLGELANVIPYGGCATPAQPVGVSPLADTVAERLLEQVTGESAATGSFEERLAGEGLSVLFHKIEYPAAVVAGVMRANGIGVDLPLLEELEFELGVRLGLLREEITTAAGRAINPLSQAEVAAALREPASTVSARPGAESRPPLVDLVRQYQEMYRASDAVTKLLSRADRRTGRVHYALDSLGADTGRFSCADPPLHSLPSELRELVVAAPGHALVEADFSQIELRVLAHFSQDRLLLDAFANGIDLHRSTAARALRVTEAEVSDAMRDEVGKVVNFGIVYGQTPHGLAKKLGATEREAQSHLEAYFAAHHGVRDWIDRTQREALRDGYVTTFYGRRRRLPGLRSNDRAEVERGLRQAVNTVIQGTAAEINKSALIRLHRELDERCRLVLTVHDSVLLEVPRDRAGEVAVKVAVLMRQLPPGFRTPLAVKVGVGGTWAECQRDAR